MNEYLRIPFGDAVAVVVDWVTTHLGGFFSVIRAIVTFFYEWVEYFLSAPPFWAVVVVIAALAFVAKGWKFGLGTSLADLNQQTSVLTIPQGGFSGWQTASATFTATAATEMLGFLAATSVPGAPPFMLLDGVSLNAAAKTPAAAVPEPATLGLLLGGLGLVGVMARRRFNKRA